MPDLDLNRLTAAPPSGDAVTLVSTAVAWVVLGFIGLWVLRAAVGAVLLGAARLPGLGGQAARDLRLAGARTLPKLVRPLLVTTLGLAGVTGQSVVMANPVASSPAAPTPAPPTIDRGPLQQPADDNDRRITVRSGDCLWSLTSELLGGNATDAEIAQSWPSLYAANRSVIGPDPDLVLPGQHLRVPAAIAQDAR